MLTKRKGLRTCFSKPLPHSPGPVLVQSPVFQSLPGTRWLCCGHHRLRASTFTDSTGGASWGIGVSLPGTDRRSSSVINIVLQPKRDTLGRYRRAGQQVTLGPGERSWGHQGRCWCRAQRQHLTHLSPQRGPGAPTCSAGHEVLPHLWLPQPCPRSRTARAACSEFQMTNLMFVTFWRTLRFVLLFVCLFESF